MFKYSLTVKEINELKKVIFDNRFHFYITKETEKEFVITSRSEYFSLDEVNELDKESKRHDDWTMVDRSTYEVVVNKFNKQIVPENGTYFFVIYKGWQLRYYDNTEDKYLLYVDNWKFARENGFEEIEEGSLRYVKWVSKSECEEIDVEAERKKLGL